MKSCFSDGLQGSASKGWEAKRKSIFQNQTLYSRDSRMYEGKTGPDRQLRKNNDGIACSIVKFLCI